MHESRRGDQCVAFGAPVGNMEACAAQGNGRIDRQDATLEPWQDLPVQPFTQDIAARGILSFDLQDAEFKFKHGD